MTKKLILEEEEEKKDFTFIKWNEDLFIINLSILRDFYSKRNKMNVFENRVTEQAQNLIKLFKKEIPKDKVYIKRLTKEFKLISQNNFFPVFIQVCEILELAGSNTPHIIRGSAGSCLVCYLLTITNIDPIKENISLSRFMHELREDMPDIDIDFPWNQRDDIYKKVFHHWENKVARISNHIRYKEKSAMKEAIRREGYHKFIPREYDLEEIFDDEKTIKKVEEESRKLIGQFRCYSLHCGGIVIFNNDVPNNLYLRDFEIGKKSGIMGKQIWMDKDGVEDAGFIKIDILSNRGLGQLWDISKMDIENYPQNDDKAYSLLSNGENLGITFGESRGMMKIFMTMKPQSLEDIATALALIRPAAAKNYQKSAFLRDYSCYLSDDKRKKYIIYDDDATQFIQNKIGCDESEADIFRKAFAKNKPWKKQEFLNRVPQHERKFVKEQLEQLQLYSFCKSHAFSYAKLVYALAYQKAHNPKEFWLATLNNCNSSYRKWVHFREARNAGIKLCFGKRPFVLKGNKLMCKNAKVKTSIFDFYSSTEKKQKENMVKQYFENGYWISDDFLPGMYLEEYWTPITKRHTKISTEKNIIRDRDNIRYAKFRGLVATGRIYKKEDGSGFLTFLTIGYEDGKYIDLILYGKYKISKIHCIKGYGKLKTDGFCEWIDVLKTEFDRL